MEVMVKGVEIAVLREREGEDQEVVFTFEQTFLMEMEIFGLREVTVQTIAVQAGVAAAVFL
jgi:hypothetical protein